MALLAAKLLQVGIRKQQGVATPCLPHLMMPVILAFRTHPPSFQLSERNQPYPLVIPAKGFSGKSCSCRNLCHLSQEFPRLFWLLCIQF